MEEKEHFKYNAEINLKSSNKSEFSRVLQMSNLQPMAVKWEDFEGQERISLFYLDFFEEKVYDNSMKISSSPLSNAVKEILQEKKYAAQQPVLSEEFLKNVIDRQQQILERRPNAGTDQFKG